MTYHPIRDFNGDGRSDLLWFNKTTQDLYLWEMNGVSFAGGGYVTTLPAASGVPPMSWSITGSGDFNGDGKTDLILQRDSGPFSSDQFIWDMNGRLVSSTTYLSSVNYNNSPPLVFFGSNDFNGDGTTDLITVNIFTRDMVLWQMANNHPAAYGYIATAPTGWNLAATGDFTGDGKADILWKDANDNLFLWGMDANHVTSSDYVGTMPAANWTLAASGDFNGDGKVDLLWMQKSTGNLFLWDMDGHSAVGGGYVATLNPNLWHLAGTGDFDGDGKMDLLWQDTSGNLYQWQMNDTHVTGGGYIGTMGSNWALENI